MYGTVNNLMTYTRYDTGIDGRSAVLIYTHQNRERIATGILIANVTGERKTSSIQQSFKNRIERLNTKKSIFENLSGYREKLRSDKVKQTNRDKWH